MPLSLKRHACNKRRSSAPPWLLSTKVIRRLLVTISAVLVPVLVAAAMAVAAATAGGRVASAVAVVALVGAVLAMAIVIAAGFAKSMVTRRMIARTLPGQCARTSVGNNSLPLQQQLQQTTMWAAWPTLMVSPRWPVLMLLCGWWTALPHITSLVTAPFSPTPNLPMSLSPILVTAGTEPA
jgi:hypothetical protein